MLRMLMTVGLAILAGCANDSKIASEIASEALRQRGKTIEDASGLRFQLVVTEVRNGNRKDHSFRADAEYFYPASTIKILGAIAAVHEFEARGAPLDSKLTWNDITNDGEPLSVADKGEIRLDRELRRMLIISDNEAFNLCYDIAGQNEINELARSIGLSSVRINHRLSRSAPPGMGTVTGGATIHLNERQAISIPRREGRIESAPRGSAGLSVGDGVMKSGVVNREPMDFTNRNAISIRDLHELTISLTHPELSELVLPIRNRGVIAEAMGMLPRESVDPTFDAKTYPDDWGKFFLPGVSRVIDAKHLRIENKVGLAYGFLIDSARIIDVRENREFFMTAVMYVNSDGVLNDDRYDYETLGLPLMADLGEAAAKRFLVP